MPNPEGIRIDPNFEVFSQKRQYFECKRGDALLEEGVPTTCAKHKLRLTLTPRDDGDINLMCPEGDTLYVLKLNLQGKK
ncbi:hypothetical protein A3F32_01425 [Candidatus Roizmanbacteria bacterium RIFCSPHIGHO2_12_FULL_42_10]|uniref:Uncharacterized protein n=2 Tax=Candidatus Roizmaniibacteriota TaxID=1752723 RepID=A0A1F7I5Q4_9BACT|nr:MAG: hypothetical protein A3C28_03305 [Candidatus Roizmanbacteria bacterium RIFCSPHIGHO2_02_FULL_39_9]OGK38701.1 MAG: hypothetical protein A3F32_01425 [Candidatus Roizmanbacteria bacterium RIFCSPHIGHO2_12_FULL_42_10]